MAKRAKPEPDEGDDGVARERTCAVTRAKGSVDGMIRFVADPDGRVVPDLAAKLPGRGVWLDGTREVLERAIKTKAFSRSLKHQVQSRLELADQTGQLLRQRAIQSFSVANKAGEILTGFAKVEAAIIRLNGQLVLVHASDASPDGCRKLEGKLRKTRPDHQQAPIQIFTGVELSLALGYPNVIHAALTGGGASDQLQRNIARLLRFSGLTGDVPLDAAVVGDAEQGLAESE